MSAKLKLQKAANISDINKQILEIKKKIQLSEGQRKALFEVRETETKENSDKINKLKKEVRELVVTLRENRSTSAKCRIKSSRLDVTMGPLTEKSCSDAQELLDLKIIDKSKQLNLIRYRIQKRQTHLTKLAKVYNQLLVKKEKKELYEKVDLPVKTLSTELQNNIHAVKVQWREAGHVRKRYEDIQRSLQSDAARFEFNIKCAEEQLRIQSQEIDRLQKIAEEAVLMRSAARAELQQQEKAALNAGKARDQQENEGKRLVIKGKQELEKLERTIFQSGKTPIRSEADTGDEIQVDGETEVETPESDDPTLAIFENLKEATGSTSVEEVVERFRSQKETDIRLNSLREASEIEKKELVKKQDALTLEVERYKFAEAKDAEGNVESAERFKKLIAKQHELAESYIVALRKAEEIIDMVYKSLNKIYLAIHPMAPVKSDLNEVFKCLKIELREAIIEVEEVAEVLLEVDDVEEVTDEDEWLPPPYKSLIRPLPAQQEETSPIAAAPGGSEDEEEVPTRGYLKRQAQLVVDARIRRKNMRMQRK